MPQGVARIAPQDLLLKLEQQLSQGGTPTGSNLAGAGLADRAFLTLWPDDLLTKSPVAKQFVVIRPNRFPVWQTIIQGAGAPVTTGYAGNNTMTGHNTVASIVCFAQINADIDLKSKQAITAETLSALALVLKVIAAVQLWNPFDPTTSANPNGPDTYLREPARMTDGGFNLEPKRISEAWWNRAAFDLEMKYTALYPSKPT